MNSTFFDEVIDRRGTNSARWDTMDKKYNCNDVIHLEVADMDFRSSDAIREGLMKCVEHGVFGYTDLSNAFYSGVVHWYKERKNVDVKTDEIVFCPRINIGLGLCVEAFTQKGDEVLINTPGYMPLYDAVKKNGRVPVECPLVFENGRYFQNFDQIEALISSKTKIFVLCNPHNPAGRVWTEEELRRLGEICVKHNLILFSDEIHGDIVSAGSKFTSTLRLPEDVRQRLIAASSISKTFNVPGSIISYMIVPNSRLREIIRSQIDRVGMHNPNIFSMSIIENAYYHSDAWYEAMLQYIDENEKFTRSYFKTNMPEIEFAEREATYLLWGNYSKLNCSEEQMERWFIEEAKVGVYMGSDFGRGGQGYFRMNIASPRALLEKAYENMRAKYDMLKHINQI